MIYFEVSNCPYFTLLVVEKRITTWLSQILPVPINKYKGKDSYTGGHQAASLPEALIQHRTDLQNLKPSHQAKPLTMNLTSSNPSRHLGCLCCRGRRLLSKAEVGVLGKLDTSFLNSETLLLLWRRVGEGDLGGRQGGEVAEVGFIQNQGGFHWRVAGWGVELIICLPLLAIFIQ